MASDTVLAIYLVFAFASFDSKGESKTLCSKVNIEIADDATSGFLDAKVIKERLQKAGYYPIGRQMRDIKTRQIEDMLRTSPFVKTAECYKTEGGAVYISVTQRMPVIRIKADSGDDYYVDDNDCVMPRSNYTSDLIIATGCISRWYATNYLSPLGKAIMQNDLWKNLIEQINVLPDHGVEIVPRIGDHVVYIGRLPDSKNRQKHEQDIADFINRKMTRLEKFYRYGLSQVGWNKYSYINIEFDNQIICKKHGEAQPRPAEPAEPPTPATETAANTPAELSEGEPAETAKTENKAEAKPAEAKKKAEAKPAEAKNKAGNKNEANKNKKKSSN